MIPRHHFATETSFATGGAGLSIVQAGRPAPVRVRPDHSAKSVSYRVFVVVPMMRF